MKRKIDGILGRSGRVRSGSVPTLLFSSAEAKIICHVVLACSLFLMVERQWFEND